MATRIARPRARRTVATADTVAARGGARRAPRTVRGADVATYADTVRAYVHASVHGASPRTLTALLDDCDRARSAIAHRGIADA